MVARKRRQVEVLASRSSDQESKIEGILKTIDLVVAVAACHIVNNYSVAARIRVVADIEVVDHIAAADCIRHDYIVVAEAVEGILDQEDIAVVAGMEVVETEHRATVIEEGHNCLGKTGSGQPS